MSTFQTYLLWTFYSVASLLLAVWLAWHLCAQVNFLYPVWYSLLDIDQTIERTIPQHLHKKQFGQTTKQEHYRLFAEIVRSVQANGRGLQQIQYRDRDGKVLDRLLTQNEIIHLNDVARLISSLNWLSLMLFVICLLLLALIFLTRMSVPTLRNLLITVLTAFVVGVGMLSVFGFKKVFYWLHTIVFPADHQWFFYYEESLMSTLMKLLF